MLGKCRSYAFFVDIFCSILLIVANVWIEMCHDHMIAAPFSASFFEREKLSKIFLLKYNVMT